MLDILIKDSLIVDGLGSPPFLGSIGIKGEYITAIEKDIKERAEYVIYAEGKVVSPGFIDIRTHSDQSILLNPKAENKLLQGVTTEIGGSCGFSIAPCKGEFKNKIHTLCSELGINLTWNSVDKYFNSIERNGTSINFGLLVGSESIKASVVGYSRTTPTFKDIEDMKELVAESLNEGAFGLSSNHASSFGSKIKTNETSQLVQVLERFKGFHAIHLRSSGDKILKAIDEVINLSRGFRPITNISHLGIIGKDYWYKIDSLLYKIEKDSEENPVISCDCYPYSGLINKLDCILPKFIKELPDNERIKYLYRPSSKKMISEEMFRLDPKATFLENTLIFKVVNEENEWMEGKSLSQIGNKLKVENYSLEFIFNLLSKEELKTLAIFYLQDKEIIDKIMCKPYCIPTSNNSIYHENSHLIPTFGLFDAFPYFINEYVSMQKLLSLEEAIYKITSFPATRLGINKRGTIKEGMYADLVIFDMENLPTHTDSSNLHQPPEGIEYVIVNGTIVIEKGIHTNTFPGKVLRREFLCA